MSRKIGRPVTVDYTKMQTLLKSGMNLTSVALAVGCSISTVHRFSKLPAADRRKLAK